MKLPSPKEVLEAYEKDEQVRGFVEHNVGYWRNIVGAWTLVASSKLNFRPREDYWFLVERRVLVSYFANELGQLYSPPSPMRQLAFRVFRHFDQARQEGRLGPVIEAKDQPAHWSNLSTALLQTAQQMPDLDEYAKLGPRSKQRHEKTLKDSLVAFLEKAAALDGPGELDQPFRFRLPWFPYLGLTNQEGLIERQTFFAGFYTLFASTNSYKQGGAQSIAPILQNNPSAEILDYVRKWAEGKTPAETGFQTLAKESRKDRSDYAPVIELYTFLNLHHQPIYNNAARIYGGLDEASGPQLYIRLREIGAATHQFLKSNPSVVESLSTRFRRLVSSAAGDLPIVMEAALGLEIPQDPALAPADVAIECAIREAGVRRATEISTTDAAASLYHLMIDSFVYASGRKPQSAERAAGVVPSPAPAPAPAAAHPRVEETLELPLSLRPKANDALAYLRAEFHVLFAGVPGTGKTTVAQFVGHAWDHDLSNVELRIPRSQAPFMTVGNSAWAPFHTIGGILPDGQGRFLSHTGIFIDPSSRGKDEWHLRSHAVLLDEMNRADLDRAIGELYPILSRSVESVVPAGIPGVKAVRLHPRFRILATVNDSTLDDIVFPISEGLARRFVRIDLPGATREEVWSLLLTRAGSEKKDRLDAAHEAVTSLFSICEALGQVARSEEGLRLPFGAGYFGLLGSWTSGTLRLSEEFERLELKDQARRVLATSISSAARNAAMKEVLRKLSSQLDAE